MDGVRRSTAITAFAAICLALGIAACGGGEELPTFPPPRDVIIVTATPEPTRPPAPTPHPNAQPVPAGPDKRPQVPCGAPARTVRDKRPEAVRGPHLPERLGRHQGRILRQLP